MAKAFVKAHSFSPRLRWAEISYPLGNVLIISVGQFGLLLDEKTGGFFSKNKLLAHIKDIDALSQYLQIMSELQISCDDFDDEITPHTVTDPALRVIVNQALLCKSGQTFASGLAEWMSLYYTNRR